MGLSRVTEMNVHIAYSGNYRKPLTVYYLISLTFKAFAYRFNNIVVNKNIEIPFGPVTAVNKIAALQ